jgi:glyceraldehyde-3-phosphate dehydrogenase (NADP+)
MRRLMEMDHPYCLAGEWIDDGERFEVLSPWDGKQVGATYRPSAAAVETAIERAGAARAVLAEMPLYERVGILKDIARRIEESSEDLTEMIALEAGKPLRYARGEAARAVQTFTEAAAECSRLYGEIIPLDVTPQGAGRTGMTGFFPLGTVLAVTPFNFPLNLVAHKLAPALAAGCPAILKPSSETPLTSLMLARLIVDGGAPAGALSVLPLEGARCGELALRSEIRKVTFTGSAEVGWDLKRRAYDKRVTLELGGNAAVILHDDWDDMDAAIERICTGGYAYSGQVCISIQRIYVHSRIYREFIERFLARVASLRKGDPLAEETDIGPMITEGEAKRVEEWVNEAVAGGAKVLAGGGRSGGYYEPTVIEGAKQGMKVVDEEIFGPVTVVSSYDDFEKALAMADDSRFGLQAGVYTRDLRLAMRAFRRLEVGGVVVGDVPTFRIDRMPYGGVKRSGSGREGLRYAIREMCEQRLLVIGF